MEITSKQVTPEQVNEVYRKIEEKEEGEEVEGFSTSNGDVLLYDSCLRDIIMNLDSTSKYLIIQYIKNKGQMSSKELINEINADIKEYYKTKKKYIKVKRCYRCYKYIVVSNFNRGHYVMPLEYGGDNSEYNKVFLCRTCHDYVELETLKLIELNKNISVNELKTYIRTDFPVY